MLRIAISKQLGEENWLLENLFLKDFLSLSRHHNIAQEVQQ
jgi:hypothetical protein